MRRSNGSLFEPVPTELVVLLDPAGQPIGEQPKSEVHHADTPLHLAFSLYLFDEGGRVLITRRALGKLTWPGVWTNSCCGHPGPGESTERSIARRLQAELGTRAADLRCVLPDFRYRARDSNGVWENEICPVHVARLAPDAAIEANSREVCEWTWVDWDALSSAIFATPFAFSPWAVEQVSQLVALASDLTGDDGFHT